MLSILASVLNVAPHAAYVWQVIAVHGQPAVCQVAEHAGQLYANGCFR
jgi:hypothetical protein